MRQASLADLITEFRRRTACSGSPDSSARLHLRDQLFREAGGLNYDDISHEFQTLARQLRWPPQATLKDFRHAFATMLGNSPLAEAYKKYLMGQSPGPAALHAYTHLNQLREQFQAAVGGAWAELLAAINQAPGNSKVTLAPCRDRGPVPRRADAARSTIRPSVPCSPARPTGQGHAACPTPPRRSYGTQHVCHQVVTAHG